MIYVGEPVRDGNMGFGGGGLKFGASQLSRHMKMKSQDRQ